jgi:hypothetical protein
MRVRNLETIEYLDLRAEGQNSEIRRERKRKK